MLPGLSSFLDESPRTATNQPALHKNKLNKAITNDGGKTWKLVANGKGPGYKSSVRYIPDTNGKEVVAVGSTGISYSEDGGHNWQEISNEKDYYTIRFVNKNLGWLAGKYKIAKITFD